MPRYVSAPAITRVQNTVPMMASACSGWRTRSRLKRPSMPSPTNTLTNPTTASA